MVIPPNTNIILLKGVLEEGDPNQIDFATPEAQTDYFLGLPHLEVENYTYQRKDNIIRMEGNFDQLLNYNYVMYQNENYSDKWFYAFITRIEYVNDNTTYIYIKTDVFQTWMFEKQMKPCFVEREHANNDTPGNNTLPEGLDLGEMVASHNERLINLNIIDPIICFQVTELLSPMSVTDSGSEAPGLKSIYNGLFTGLYFFAVSDPENARNMISAYAENGKSDAIVSIFMAPRQLLGGTGYEQTYNIPIPGSAFIPVTALWFATSDTATEIDAIAYTKPTQIGETTNLYTPRNKKLLTFPYTYLYVTNYAGQEGVYHWEDFNGDTVQTSVYGAVGQGCSIRMLFRNYKYSDTQHMSGYGLVGAKLPVLAWANDYYTNWLTQNTANIALNRDRGAFQIASNLVQGNIGGAIAGIDNIMGLMAQKQQAQLIPDQAAGQANCSDINYSLGYIGFAPTCMSIRREYAERIDSYFDRFGYATQTTKLPNLTGRRFWNFVKTVECYIEGDFPQDDIVELKSMFDRGLTIWHDPNFFMDYTKNNAII